MQETEQYLKKRCEFTGHDGAVRLLASVAAQHKGAAFISSCGEKVKLWKQNEDGWGFRERPVVERSSNFVRSLCALLPDKDHPNGVVLIGSSEATIQAYSASTNDLLYTLKDHTDSVCALTVGKYRTFVSGSWDKTAKVWLNQKCLLTLTGHTGAVLCIVIVGGYILTGSSDTSIRRWKAGKCEHTMSGHSDSVRDLCPLTESEFLSCSSDGTIRQWSVSGEILRIYGQHGGSVFCLAVLPDGRGFVSAGEDERMCAWKDGRLLQTVTHGTPVRCLCVLPTGDVVCGDSNKVIRVYAYNPEFSSTATREKFFKEFYRRNDGKKSHPTIRSKETSNFNQSGKGVPLSEYFPTTSFMTFANVDKRGIFGKLRLFNLEVLDEHRLSRNDLQLLESSVSGCNSPPQEYFQALWKVLGWPEAENRLFPALDLLRFSILDKNISEELCSLENGESFVDYVCRVLSSESSTNRTLILRVLCNTFRHPCGRRLLVSNFDRVMAPVLRLQSEFKPSVQTMQTTLLINYAVAFRRDLSNEGGRAKFLRAAAELSQSIFEPEACFLLLVAIGTAVHDDRVHQKMACKLDMQNFINMCRGCEVEKVFKAAEMVSSWIE